MGRRDAVCRDVCRRASLTTAARHRQGPTRELSSIFYFLTSYVVVVVIERAASSHRVRLFFFFDDRGSGRTSNYCRMKMLYTSKVKKKL